MPKVIIIATAISLLLPISLCVLSIVQDVQILKESGGRFISRAERVEANRDCLRAGHRAEDCKYLYVDYIKETKNEN